MRDKIDINYWGSGCFSGEEHIELRIYDPEVVKDIFEMMENNARNAMSTWDYKDAEFWLSKLNELDDYIKEMKKDKEAKEDE